MNTATSLDLTPRARPEPRFLSTAELVAHIVESHHAYLRGALPYLVPLAAKVANVHGDHDPRLRDLRAEFFELRETLDEHLDDEEQRLFRGVVSDAPDPELLAGMHDEHREVKRALGRLRALSDGYTPPSWACNSYKKLLAELRALDEDLVQHMRIEDDVLAPRFGGRP